MIMKSINNVDLYLMKCIGLHVSDIWLGEGKAIFIEIGKLHKHIDKRRHKSKGIGDITLMFDCRWRLEKLNSIILGSLDETSTIEKQIKHIIGKSVKSISFIGRIPEIVVEFDKNLWIQSFTSYKSEDWGIMFYKEGSIGRRRRNITFKKNEKFFKRHSTLQFNSLA